MKKVIFASDSFKGSLSCSQINALLTACAKAHFPNCACVPFAIADGGEGTLEAMIANKNGKIVQAEVQNPLKKPILSRYVTIDGAAVICMSEASGLPLLAESERSAKATTTYGTGELILHALQSGYKCIYVTLGGSATNDGGTGALSALGYRFLDENGNELDGTGENLSKISSIDASNAVDISDVQFTLLCDVSNPLLGEKGATYTYGKQKGATREELDCLEQGMQNFASVAKAYLGKEMNVSGGGAAGGLGAALYAFLGAKIQSGIETVLTLCDFDSALIGADLVITGEGRIDYQSANGKVIDGILRHANEKGVPVVAIAGSIGEGIEQLYAKGLLAAFSIVNKPMDLQTALANAENLYMQTAENVFRIIKATEKQKE